MSNCPDCQKSATASANHVPNFTVTGFGNVNQSVAPPPALEGVRALDMSVCVSATYNSGTNQICFTIPAFGNYCINSPIHIPFGGELKVCAQTCGSFIPTGLKATVYLNNNPIWSGTLFGSC